MGLTELCKILRYLRRRYDFFIFFITIIVILFYFIFKNSITVDFECYSLYALQLQIAFLSLNI